MDTAALGRLVLDATVATSLWGAAASIWGGQRRDPRLMASGRRSLYATAGLLVVAVAWLEVALNRHDFSNAYVAEVTSTT